MRFFSVDLYGYFKIAKPEGARAELDCYIPDRSIEINAQRKSPAMLVLGGGGYGMVSFREGESIAVKFLSKGFVSFSLKYSVAPNRFPRQLAEAVMAMNYIRLNADEFGLEHDNHITNRLGKRVNGFWGIEALVTPPIL